jgi:hypothetical protein
MKIVDLLEAMIYWDVRSLVRGLLTIQRSGFIGGPWNLSKTIDLSVVYEVVGSLWIYLRPEK